MRKRLLFTICAVLVANHLVAQCNRCDSFFQAQGIYIVPPEEIKKHPGKYRNLPTVECPAEYNCEKQESGPVGDGIHFRSKWGYGSLRVGVNYDELTTSGLHADGFRFDRPRQKYIAAAFDLDAPEWVGIVIRLELAWKPQSFDGMNENAEGGPIRWQIKANRISKEVSVLYKYTRGKLRWFAGAGLGRDRATMQINTNTYYQYDKKGQPETLESNNKVERSNWFTALSAGIMFWNRLEVRYKRIGTQWSVQTPVYNIRNNANVLTVGYRI